MIRVDNTILTSGVCSAQSVARHVLGRAGLERKDAALVGNACHEGLLKHFEGKSVDESERALLEAYDELMGEVPPEQERLGRENVRRIMRHFFETRPLNKFKFQVVEGERSVHVELAEGIEFWMKRDLLVKGEDGMFYPLDHKTTGSITDWWMKKFRVGSQMSGYAWGTEEQRNVPVPGVYINAIEIKKLPDSTRKCRTHGVSYAECALQHTNFQFLVTSRTPEMLASWKRDAIMIANRLKIEWEAYPTLRHLPYAPRQGAFFDACTFCEFSKWCKLDFKPELMKEYTKEEWWKPWETN